MRIVLCLGVLIGCGGAAPAPELVVRGNGIVMGSINRVSARILIDPAAPATPVLTTALARRAGLKAGPFDWDYAIGPRKIAGDSAVGRVDVGLGPTKRRIGWTEAAYRPGVEAVVGPGLLPAAIVRFELRPPRPGEQVSRFPLVGQGGIDSPWGERFALIELAGAPLRVQFDPASPRSVATASAGLRLSRALGGRMSGTAEPVAIAFGVERPVRTLLLGRPLRIGNLSLSSLGVRTHDFGSVTAIPEEGADPDEIVVVARRKTGPEQLKLGADVLGRCSSITFDRAARQIRLSCL